MMSDPPSKSPANQNRAFLRRLVSFIFWTTLFTLAYAQSPLYTSNQNQYFLHGLADAGFGYLDQDWLANTLDPTPVFSGLITLTGRFLPWPPVTYFYFTILAGIYLFSLYGILSTNFRINGSISKRWFYIFALIFFHSAALRYLVVRLFNQDWAYLFDGGVAGQRLLGSVFQPSIFGVLLLLSIYLYLQGKTAGAVVSLALAPVLHPTYLLSAAVVTLVYMGLEYYEKRQLLSPLTIGIGALLGVLPILVPTFLTFGGTDPGMTARARELLVDFRIPHHASITEWFDGSVIIKIVFILLGIYLTRKTRLFHFLCWPFFIAILGTSVQFITRSDVLALLFPWRLSTWLMPLSLGVVLFWSLEFFWSLLEGRVSAKLIQVMTVTGLLILAGSGLAKSIWEYREKQNGSDRPMMAFVSENKAPEDIYLIPLDMQDFRLETGAPAYVEFKSIPYKDEDVLEWFRRVRAAGNLYRVPYKRTGCVMVADLSLEGVTHIVLPYDHTIKTCSNLESRYGDWHYGVYEISEQGERE
jgi:hypothetical protein